MKIGILTFHNTPNFGATLQCHALFRHLSGAGREVEIINYGPPAMFKAYKRELFRRPRGSWRNVARVARFYRFVMSNLRLSGSRIVRGEGLAALRDRYDWVVVGSDEVWKVESRMRPFDPAYYLNFADPSRTRITSYAASSSIQSDMRASAELVTPLLRRFHAISVRDENTAGMVEDLTGTRPVEVLDPTFLWDFKPESERPLIEGDYLALYGWPDARQSTALREYARGKGLKVVAVGCSNAAADESFLGIGPAEWMRLIRHSKFFVTDYFHGAAFALHFEVPFAVYVNPWKKAKISSLMSHAEVTHRLFDNIEAFVGSEEAHAPIDFGAVRESIRPHLERSRSFLREQAQLAGRGI